MYYPKAVNRVIGLRPDNSTLLSKLMFMGFQTHISKKMCVTFKRNSVSFRNEKEEEEVQKQNK